MIGQHFYHETIKAAVGTFGALFNNIKIKRKDGAVIPVPIAYGPRQKWAEAHKAHDRADEQFENYLPRLSYEMVAMTYDANRKLTNKQRLIRNPDRRDAPRQTIVTPVPYNIDFTLYLETKTLNDGWQVLEQILPFFTPAYTVAVRHFPVDQDPNTPVPENEFDMPITLNALTWADDWQGEVQTRRVIEWNLEFQAKILLAGPVAQTKVIYDSRVALLVKNNVDNLATLSRNDSDLTGSEVGYIRQKDSDFTDTYDRYQRSSDLDFTFTNLVDSDGTVVKVIRDIGLL